MTPIAGINTFNCGSTGRLMLQIGEGAVAAGYEFYPCVPKCRDNAKAQPQPQNQILIGNRITRNIHGVLSGITGLEGCFSHFDTYRLLAHLKAIQPRIVHLHNIHGSFINFKLLFDYLRKSKVQVIWTLHDCWSFTGRCPYFIATKCEKWKTGCGACPYPKDEYPGAWINTTKYMWNQKREAFSTMRNITLVTPSDWLAELVSQSFLRKHRMLTINNGINLGAFREASASFRNKHGLQDAHIILGVAYNWDRRKGLDDFIRLRRDLSDDFVIVLVGTNEETEALLPQGVISVRRTASQQELAEIYSSADIFVNPTREDNYPTVNIEALACGTPVITYGVGGSGEMITPASGRIVKAGDYDQLLSEIMRSRTNPSFLAQDCIAQSEKYSIEKCVNQYIELYDELLEKDR